MRVLDCSIALTGPYAAALLADQGADVIKVERPGIGDIARWVGVMVNGMSSLYLVCNRGKRSDRGRPAARPTASTWCAGSPTQSDVVIQNFRPGVMDRLGLGYDDLAAVNPDVVYVSLSGFGAVGPYRDRSVVRHRDPGLRRLRGEPGRSHRRRARVPPPDCGRQGDRAVRGAGDHRRAVRA